MSKPVLSRRELSSAHPSISTGYSESGGSITTSGSEFISRAVSFGWGWRSSLALQFQLQFSILLAITIFFGTLMVLVDVAFAMGLSEEATEDEISKNNESIFILYAFDFIYLIDLMLMTIYKRLLSRRIFWKYRPRVGIVLFLEYVTLCPMDAIYYTFSGTNYRVYNILRLRYAIRIFRVLLFYKQERFSFLRRYVSHLILIMGSVAIATTFATVIAVITACRATNCDRRIGATFKTTAFLFLTKITDMGVPAEDSSESSISVNWLFGSGICFFFFNMYLISNFVCDIIVLTDEKFALVFSFQRLAMRLTRLKLFEIVPDPDKYRHWLQVSYDIFWQKKKGLTTNIVLRNRYLPEIKKKEIMLDMGWIPLQHSHLFRDQPVEFLRHVAQFMRHMYTVPGEIIYEKGKLKSQFVYIVSGVVQILSEEDNETPSISFSDGTCFGETCLLVDYPSTATVICKDYCELCVLERKDFIKMSGLHVNKMRKFLSVTLSRYDYVKHFAVLSKLQITNTSKQEEMHIKWLKYTLRKLLYGEERVESRHVKRGLESIVFCTMYLDMLVIAQEIKLVTDTVFLKKTFPYIFQPTSSVLTGWKRLITIVFFFHAFFYLYTTQITLVISNTYLVSHIFVSILWILDLYIETSTAVQTSQRFLVTVSDIVSYKMTDLTYLLNILAAVSPGLFVMILYPTSTAAHILVFEFNKLFKAYKIEEIFESIKFVSIKRTVLLIYLKFALYLFLLIYYLSGLWVITVCSVGQCTPDFEAYREERSFDLPQVWFYFFHLTIQFVCSFRISIKDFHSYDMLIAMQAVLFLFQLVFLASRTSAEAMKYCDIQYISDYSVRIKTMMRAFNNEAVLHQAYQSMQLRYKYDEVNFLYERHMFDVLPAGLLKILRGIIYKNDILRFPIFRGIRKDTMEELSCYVQTMVINENSLIISEGEYSDRMYLIKNGSCTIKSHKTHSRTLHPGDTFCVFETCLQVNSFNSVKARSNCELLVLKFEYFQRVALNHLDYYDAWRRTAKYFGRQLALLSPPSFVDCDPPVLVAKIKWREYLGVSYHPVERIPRWARGFKFVLLPYTVKPDKALIIAWEITRWIFAFLSTAVSTAFPMSCVVATNIYKYLILLDVASWVDIYFRHHVQYFNEEGLYVSHPFWTAKNYWKTAFLVDLFAALPFDYVHLVMNPIGRNAMTPFYWRLNRVVQLYRLGGVVQYFNTFNIRHIKTVESLKYAVIAVASISIIWRLHFTHICVFVEGCVATCKSDLMSANATQDERTTVQFSMVSFLFSSSLFLNMYYYKGIDLKREEDMVIIVGVIGFLFFCYAQSNIIAVYLTRNFNLILYQDAMTDLVKFMATRRVDKRLKNEIIYHFESLWHRKKGLRLHILTASFNEIAKKLIYMDIMGTKILQSSIFSKADPAVMRTVVTVGTHEIILKEGIVYRVNDVIDKLFFVYKGRIEVIGADGNNLQFLSEGSIFGNLDNVERARQTLTMTACGHVELIEFNSLKFHAALSKYSRAYRRFLRLISANVDFIENKAVGVKKGMKMLSQRKKSPAKLYDTNRWMKLFKHFMVFVSFTSFIVETYHVATLHNDPLIITVIYSCDCLYVLRIFLKFNTAYLDQFGNLIKNKRMIAEKYKSSIFAHDMVSTFPIELLALIALTHSNILAVKFWTYLRLNRVIRISYMISRAKNMVHRLNTNAFWVRTMYSTLMLFIYLHCLTVVLCFADSLRKDVYMLTDEEKINYFFRYWKRLLEMVVKLSQSFDATHLTNPMFMYVTVTCMLISRWVVITYLAEVVGTTLILNNRRSIFETFAKKLKTFMQLQYLSPPLQSSTNEYLNLLWTDYNGEQMPRLLNLAPYYLKEGVLNSMFGVHLRRHPIFKKCHVDLIRQITYHFQLAKFFAGDTIVYTGDIDHCMYFIYKGTVELLTIDSLHQEIVDTVLEESQMFGFNQGIYTKCGHEYTYRVRMNTLILILKREDWIHLLDFFPASKLYLYDKEIEKKFTA